MSLTRTSALASAILFSLAIASAAPAADQKLAAHSKATRQISGVYPHLTTYGIYSQSGAHRKQGHNECGIGAVVPWAGRLWMVNYAPHMPLGSEHKLYSVDQNLKLTIHPESVGGTPAARMIHRESNQLLIGHYLIDSAGKIRVISPKVMPGRLTAIARHLTDPANMVYYCDMEGMLYEANVHTLKVNKLFHKPVPGWHCKGGYTSQGRLVIANNGERGPGSGSYAQLLVGGPAKNDEEVGVLAEWDGHQWRIIERRQFTDVTGPGGIYGAPHDRSPLWAIGWDRRSLRLKLLDQGKWHTFLLPKAAHNNDPKHGWYTEWPRIREIGDGRLMMDMHGMFFDFPKTFSAANTAGLRPIASHLRYIPDFCHFNGRLVLASDETSIQGNRLAGQPQSNLWFGRFDDLEAWGPASAYGGPWVADAVKANAPSDPFLVGGFDRRVLHLALGGNLRPASTVKSLRASDQQVITSIPRMLASLPRVTIQRGDWHKPAPGYSFTVNRPVTVYLAVDRRGQPDPGEGWSKTGLTLTWGQSYSDLLYRRKFEAGIIEIPGNNTEHAPGAFGMPHAAFVVSDYDDLKIEPAKIATVRIPAPKPPKPPATKGPVRFTLEIDVDGKGTWKAYTTVEVSEDGYAFHVFPEDFEAQWVRIRADKDCTATAYFHLTGEDFQDGAAGPNRELFAGLAEVDANDARSALVYAAKRNRNLRVITGDDRYFEFAKASFEFEPDKADEELADLLAIEPRFTIDRASVILTAGKRRLRLPRGNAAFDKPFASGWPRGSREVESERHLANVHGTFYEVPLITNGRPPAFELMRPVASHSKQITDFCTWNGLLVLAGVRHDHAPDGHVVADAENQAALWFGGVDDLWKLGKPVGQGGPWKDTAVKAGEPSDPYLMTGYDRKTLRLRADRDVTIAVEVDIDHQSGWHEYRTFEVKAGQPTTFVFPEGFSAHWMRTIADSDCQATAWLTYQ